MFYIDHTDQFAQYWMFFFVSTIPTAVFTQNLTNTDKNESMSGKQKWNTYDTCKQNNFYMLMNKHTHY